MQGLDLKIGLQGSGSSNGQGDIPLLCMTTSCVAFSYYHTKYNRVQVAVPHVVNHYAAGARLIGLTEKQIKQHLMHLKATNARE